MSKRVTGKIKKFLTEKGESSSTEIADYLNSTMRHGVTMQQLGNLLGKDKDIVKVGTTRKNGTLPSRYEICIWGLSPKFNKSRTFEGVDETAKIVIDWLSTQPSGYYRPKHIEKSLDMPDIPREVYLKIDQSELPSWVEIQHTNRGRCYCVRTRT